MNQQTRWFASALPLVLLLLLLADVAKAQGDCSVNTCSGPVSVGFNTPNCTGDPSYYFQSTPGASTLGHCTQSGALWELATCSSEEGRVSKYYTDSSCSDSSFARVSYTQTGFCFNNGDGSSYTSLCSVNDTFVAQKNDANGALPTYSPNGHQCDSPFNCSSDSEVIYTYYRNADVCSVANATNSYAVPRSQNYTLDACLFYSSPNLNIKISCSADYLSVSYWQNGIACIGKPVSSTITTRSCTVDVSSKRKKDNNEQHRHNLRDLDAYSAQLLQLASDDSSLIYTHQTISCIASVVPSNPSPPTPSSASTLTSLLLLQVTLIALFLFASLV